MSLHSEVRDMAKKFLAFIVFTLFAVPVLAQTAADDANRSNNPLNLAASFNIQNYFTPSIFGLDTHTNDFLLRPTLPVGPNALVPVPEIFRFTVPVSTRPDPTGGYNTGLGDPGIRRDRRRAAASRRLLDRDCGSARRPRHGSTP